jgi:hypothetical protein
MSSPSVIPAEAGIRISKPGAILAVSIVDFWIPAFAGLTGCRPLPSDKNFGNRSIVSQIERIFGRAEFAMSHLLFGGCDLLGWPTASVPEIPRHLVFSLYITCADLQASFPVGKRGTQKGF